MGLFFTSLDNYAFLVYSAPKPLYWVVLFVGLTGILATVDPHRRMRQLRSPFLAWIVFYFLVTTVWALWMRTEPEAAQALNDRYRSIAFLVAFAFLFDDPRTRRIAALSVAVAVAIASLLNIAETAGILPFADSDIVPRTPGRSGGLYVNPNDSGLAITFGLAIGIGTVPRSLRVPLVLLATAGVAATFSRSAQICLVLLILWLMARRALSTSALAVSSVAAAVFFTYSTGAMIAFLDSRGILNENTWSRLQFAADDSGRVSLAIMAWRMFESAPLAGHGLGATALWSEAVSSHNMYLGLAAEHGVLGLIMFPLVALALVASNRRITPFPLVLLVAGVFSHNLLDHRFALLAIALAAADHASGPAPALETPAGRMLAARH